MAKFVDYTQRDNAIENEIDDAAARAEQRQNIPDSVKTRFDGKSVEDVMESYAELLTEKARLGTTVGELRRTTDQLLELQLQNATPPRPDTTESIKPLTVDELYDSPDEAIRRVVNESTKASVEKLERQFAELARDKARLDLDTKYADWAREVQTDEFKDWVQQSSYRTRLARAGDSYDLDAANDLLESWYERKAGTQEVTQTQIREGQLNDAVLETSSPGSLESEVTFSRFELTEKRMAANRNDPSAKDWLRANSAAIALAYAEERITD